MITATNVLVLLSGLCAAVMPIVIWTSTAKWWKQMFGRYIVWQSLAFALILIYVAYNKLVVLLGVAPIPFKQSVALVMFAMIASVEVLGVYVFLRGRYLKRYARGPVDSGKIGQEGNQPSERR
jgi:hypothetical protein